MSEKIDIYDASLRPNGQMDRKLAHQLGEWHRTFHCWLVDTERPSLVFQLRSATNRTHPGKFDISSAGHLMAGETVEDGIREVEEEIGLRLDFNNLVFAGQRVEVSDSESGVRNREYQSVYFLPIAGLEGLRLDPAEVAGLLAIDIQDALDLFSERTESTDARVFLPDATGALSVSTRTVRRGDFIPRIQRYYLAAAICAERICKGDVDVAIS